MDQENFSMTAKIASRGSPSWISIFTAINSLWQQERARCGRIWIQAFLSPTMSCFMYLTLGALLKFPFARSTAQIPYAQFLLPGLLINSAIHNAYGNVSGSFFSCKNYGALEAILVSPLPNWAIIIGFIGGGIYRAMGVCALILAGAACFYPLKIHMAWNAVVLISCAALLFSLLGLIVGLLARSYEDLGFMTTFILMPLTYFSGSLVPIDALSEVGTRLLQFNPLAYLVQNMQAAWFGPNFCIQSTLGSCIFHTLAYSALCFWIAERLLRKASGRLSS